MDTVAVESSESNIMVGWPCLDMAGEREEALLECRVADNMGCYKGGCCQELFLAAEMYECLSKKRTARRCVEMRVGPLFWVGCRHEVGYYVFNPKDRLITLRVL